MVIQPGIAAMAIVLPSGDQDGIKKLEQEPNIENWFRGVLPSNGETIICFFFRVKHMRLFHPVICQNHLLYHN